MGVGVGATLVSVVRGRGGTLGFDEASVAGSSASTVGATSGRGKAGGICGALGAGLALDTTR